MKDLQYQTLVLEEPGEHVLTVRINRPEVRSDWGKQGAAAMTMTPDAFGKYIAEDIVKWERIVKISGAKPDQ